MAKTKPTDARRRANKAWVNRQKEAGLCVRGCGTPVVNRIACVVCTKKTNEKYKYRGKIDRMSKKIKYLTNLVEKQHVVIAELRRRLNASS